MNILLWIIMGALAGWIASLIMKTNESQGFFADIAIGILGALVGGFIMNIFGQPGTAGFSLYSLTVSVAGAVLLLFVSKTLRTQNA